METVTPVIFRESPSVIWPLVITILIGLAAHSVYTHLNHPLHSFPGPILASWTNLLHSYWFLGGRQPYKLLELHERYGPVVRTSPNELSFSSAQSWKDIYGLRQGHKTFVKSPFYDGGSFADQAHSIVSERDPRVHGQMRKDLAHAFSDRSLKDQESLIAETVDLFIEQIYTHGSGDKGTDMVMWYNLTTFDIIGSLAFGETFGGLQSGEFHFWIKLVTNALRQGALADTMSRFPVVASILKTVFPSMIEKLMRDTKIHEAHTLKLIERRLNSPSSRPDFLTRILENEDSERIQKVQLAAHASDFVTAGSETTATTLSCMTYYLLKTPRVMDILVGEIRSAFQSYDQITANSASSLKYLRAVCLEGMRVYAPLPFPLPRVVPEGGDTVDGHFLPGGTIVCTNPMAASMSEANFHQPWEFRPERWLGKNEEDDLEATQPFSLGARGCLGRNLAWIELTTITAKLLWKYDIELLNKNLDWHKSSVMATLWQKPEIINARTQASLGPEHVDLKLEMPRGGTFKHTRRQCPFSPQELSCTIETMTSLQIDEKTFPSLEGKVALVTGGANGIGFATAKILSGLGCKTFILDREPPAETLPSNSEFVSCDITSWSSMVAAFKQAKRCDIAIANAGVSEHEPFVHEVDLASDTFEEPAYNTVDVNLIGTLNFIQLAAGAMKRQKRIEGEAWMNGFGGSIVITSSATGYAPEQSLPVYGATKGALLNLLRGLRSTLPEDNISINSVAPAATITKLLPANLAAPLIAAGLPVSSAEFVGKAVVYSAVATQQSRVEDYGKDNTGSSRSKWNGRCILTLGDTYTEIEEARSKLKPFWMGMENEKLTRMQQTATDFRESKQG